MQHLVVELKEIPVMSQLEGKELYNVVGIYKQNAWRKIIGSSCTLQYSPIPNDWCNEIRHRSGLLSSMSK